MVRSDSIFLTQDPHVIPAMESVHDRTGSETIPEDAVRGAIAAAGSLEESNNQSINHFFQDFKTLKIIFFEFTL